MSTMKNATVGSRQESAKKILEVKPPANEEDKSPEVGRESNQSEEALQNEENEQEVLSPKAFDTQP